jgi:Anti-sigma-K factor rskA
LHFAVAVSGTQLAPGADGSASLTKTGSGWRIELSANGLPHLENGRYYQAWLKNAAGILVSVGTFNDAKHVTLWSGVRSRSSGPWRVTVPPADGNPISSGKPVLIGRITLSG